MTPQEKQMVEDLIRRVDATKLEERDPEAAQQIAAWTARNQDAAYILAQTVLVQSYALEQAKAQIQRLQEAPPPASPPSKTTSFLGGLFGHKDEPQPSAPQPRAAAPQGYVPVPQYGQPQYSSQYGQPQYSQPQYGQQPGYGAPQGYPPAPGGSSFLRSAATTAAGVAAGALAFEGIESLMHGFGHSAGFGGGYGSGLGDFAGGRPEETVINNYYDGSGEGRDSGYSGGFEGSSGAGHESPAALADTAGDSGLSTQQDTADDVNMDGDSGQLQADNDLPTLDDDASGLDQDASLDDSSSFDDGGSFDDSSSFDDDNS